MLSDKDVDSIIDGKLITDYNFIDNTITMGDISTWYAVGYISDTGSKIHIEFVERSIESVVRRLDLTMDQLCTLVSMRDDVMIDGTLIHRSYRKLL